MPSTDASGQSTYTLVAAAEPVTIYDLLRHTSGIVYAGFTRTAHIKDLYTKANVGWAGVTPAEQLDALAKVPLARQPGTMWEYGLSTDVVGRVVEAVTNMPLGQFLDERGFRPLRMMPPWGPRTMREFGQTSPSSRRTRAAVGEAVRPPSWPPRKYALCVAGCRAPMLAGTRCISAAFRVLHGRPWKSRAMGGVSMRTEERPMPIPSSTDHAHCSGCVCRYDGGSGVMRSLLVILVVLLATLANVHGPAINHDPNNEVERSWHLDPSGKPPDDDIQKCSK